jgi:DNA-binding winged helix-turn-helix (wHTH) protein
MPISIRKDSPQPSSRPQRIVFDNFEVDLRSGEIRNNGSRIRLQAQPFRLLVSLLVNAGQVVTREEICRDLWPTNTFVDFEHSLAAAVNKIRDALSDSADAPKYVETLPKRGYRLRWAEQLKTKWQGGRTFAIGQKAEVSDAHEPFGEQMQQEAAQELIESKRQRLLFVVVSGIAPTKRDVPSENDISTIYVT